jgi:hypothetical protein
MLSSLCRVMAAIPSVSCFLAPGDQGGKDLLLVSVPVAGSIGTWIVARLC